MIRLGSHEVTIERCAGLCLRGEGTDFLLLVSSGSLGDPLWAWAGDLNADDMREVDTALTRVVFKPLDMREVEPTKRKADRTGARYCTRPTQESKEPTNSTPQP